MHRRHIRTALCVSLAALAVSLEAQAQPQLDPFSFLSPREKSMGGRHVALADDFSVLLANPAGLADMPKNSLRRTWGYRLSVPCSTSPTSLWEAIPLNRRS